jgi:hypothetical protein
MLFQYIIDKTPDKTRFLVKMGKDGGLEVEKANYCFFGFLGIK